MLKAIGFDLHGVVLGGGNQFDENLRERFRISTEQLDKAMELNWRPFERGDISLQQFWSRLALQAGFTYDPGQVLEYWTGNYVKYHPVNHQILKLVDTLRDRGYKVAILSNTNAPHVAINTTRGIFDHFDVALMSNEIGQIKPDRAAYDALLGALGVKATELVFVDDAEENVTGAKRMGIRGVRFHNYHDLINELVAMGLRVA
jgi:HAD superfamily hydrolase (TIGR01509 family)